MSNYYRAWDCARHHINRDQNPIIVKIILDTSNSQFHLPFLISNQTAIHWIMEQIRLLMAIRIAFITFILCNF